MANKPSKTKKTAPPAKCTPGVHLKLGTIENMNCKAARQAATLAVQAHDNIRKSAEGLVFWSLFLGAVLNHMKEQLPHGQYEKWCSKFLSNRSKTTRTKMRMIAAGQLEKKPRVRAFINDIIESDMSSIPAETITKGAAMCAREFPGKQVTDMFREEKLVAQKKKQGLPPVPPTGNPQQDSALKGKRAVQNLQISLDCVCVFSGKLDDETLNELSEMLKKTSKHMGLSA